MSEIPLDIITIILSFLPVRSLLRFRCVSKPWCLQIDSPAFVKLHLSHSIKTKSNLSIILDNRKSCLLHSVDYDTLDTANLLHNPLNEAAVLGSFNGLILLQGRNNNIASSLALYNHATRKHKVIPICPLFGSYDFGAKPIAGSYGFGYDALNEDYKIISIAEYVDEKTGKWVGSDTKIYSLNSDKWKPMKEFPSELPWTKELTGFVGGAFHTLVDRKKNRVSDWPDAILVTDLIKEDYWFMELPDFVQHDVMMLSLGVLGARESLCLQVGYEGFCTEIWVMTEHGVRSSWTKLLSVAPPVLPYCTTLDTLTYSKDLSKILLNLNTILPSSKESKLCWYDLKCETFIDIPVQDLPKDNFHVHVCVGSLVPLDGFGKFKKNQQKDVVQGKRTKKARNDFLSKGFKLKL